MLAAAGAGNIMLLNKGFHLGLGKGVNRLRKLEACLPAPVFDDLVSAEALVALTAVHQGIREAAQMTGSNPGLGIHQNGGVQTDIVRILLDKLLPPGTLDIVLQLDTQRAVVPGVGKAAVDFTACKNEAAILAQSDNFVHGFLRVFHVFPLPRLAAALNKFSPNTIAYLRRGRNG